MGCKSTFARFGEGRWDGDNTTSNPDSESDIRVEGGWSILGSRGAGMGGGFSADAFNNYDAKVNCIDLILDRWAQRASAFLGSAS